MKKPFSSHFLFTYKLLLGLVVVAILYAFPFNLLGQTVPRAGFPYCQPFLGTGSTSSLPFTVVDGEGNFNGSPFIPYQTGTGLRLTEGGINLRGWVYVDLPFSPTYGIKTSFEYFIHSQGASNGLGDGFSFFLFDGAINQTTFKIGGLGGSLGYAPHGGNVTGDYTGGGLKGGYMGIGFDALGNYGNFQEKKFGGFHDPNQFNFTTPGAASRRAYPDAVTVRSPQEISDINWDNGAPPTDTNNPLYRSYQFLTGKVLYYDATYVYPPAVDYMNYRVHTAGSGDLYLNPVSKAKFVLDDPEMFKLSDGLVPSLFSCNNRPIGYRKVFIDLKPNVGNLAIPYTITVDILVDNEPVPRRIIDNQNYPYPIPAGTEFLKLGFSASTGTDFFSAIDIRNVAALVSSVDELKKPAPPELFREICIDDPNAVEFPFCVSLADQNTFIQCIQLLDQFEPADNNFVADFYQCEQPGFCAQRCIEGKKVLRVEDANGNLIGIFKASLSEEVTVGKFDQANITFERNVNSAFFGTITKYYKIIDNFGLESDAIPITITINPIPEIVSKGTSLDPSCDGQNDGELNGVIIKNLVNDPGKYTIEFYDDNNIPVTYSIVSEVVGPDGYITATFNLSGLNLGKVFIRAINPSSESLGPVCGNNGSISADPCVLEDELLFEFVQSSGTPVEIDPYQDEICEGDIFLVAPKIDPKYNPNNLVVPFKWFADENGNIPLVPGANVIDGTPVTVALSANGELSVTGLKAAGLLPKEYFFYVETSFQDNSGENAGSFCPYNGVVKSVATVKVFPELQTSFILTPDWCRTSVGAIAVTAQGGTGSKTFSLYRVGNNTPLVTQIVNGNSHTFTGLVPGVYEVEVSTQNPSCAKILSPLTIEGPTNPLIISAGPTVNAFCNSPTGELQFNLSGGNPIYTISIPQNPTAIITPPSSGGSIYTVSGLTGGLYTINVTDAKGCAVSIPMTVGADSPSSFGTTNDEICESEKATVAPTVLNLSTSIPVYKWYYKDGAGIYIQITNGLNLSGVTFAIDGSNNLSVSNLAPQAITYTYFLNVTGTKVCDQGYIPAEILVNPLPKPAAPILTQVTCNGEGNGTIQAQLTTGNLVDFEYSLIGNNGVNKPFTKNSGLFNLLPPGTYKLLIKSAKGCEVSVPDLIINEPAALVINQISKLDATCGNPNGEITFATTGGTPDGAGKYVIKINGADIGTLGPKLKPNGPADFTITDLAPGDYLIEAEDTKGCKKTLTISVLNTAVPVFDAEDVTVCEGTLAVLTPKVVSNTIGAIPVYTWSFENPSSPGQYTQINNGDVVNGITYALANGILSITGLKFSATNYKYFLTVSGANVCPSAPIQAEIKILKIPAAVFEPVHVSCFGDSNGQIKLTSVDPTGPNTFTLVETGASNSTGNFSNLKAGIYTVRVKETGSPCQSEFKVIITEPGKLEYLNPLKTDPTCGASNGSLSFDVKGGTKDYQIQINGKPISDYSFGLTGDRYEIKNLGPATYSIEIKDANACTVTNLIDLKNDDGLTVNINPINEESCVGSPANLTPVFTPALSVVPVIKWYKDAGLTQPITSSATPATDTYTYQINGSGSLTITGLPVGDYKYYLEISGPGICTLVGDATVKVFPQITAEVVVKNINCFGQKDGVITVSPTGGNGPFEIRINGGAYTPNTVFSNLAPGKFTVDIRNDVGCVTSYQAEIQNPAGPIAINKPSIIRASCDLDNGSIEDLVISGGWGTYVVEWRFGTATGPIIPGGLTGASNLAPGSYFLLITDLEGCIATFPFLIEESSDPVYAVVPPINSCVGSKVSIRPIHIAPNPSLPPAAATEILWYTSPGQTGLIASGADPSIPGVSYTIDDTDWLNPLLEIDGLPVGVHDFYFFVVCTGQEIKIETTIFETPDVTLVSDPITCFGDKNGVISILSGDQPVYTYSINGAPPINKTALEALSFAVGIYNLVVNTPAGCSQTTSFTIEGPAAALASSPLNKIDPGCGAPNGKLELTVTGGWSPYTLDIIKDGVSTGTQIFSQSNIVIDGFRPGAYQIKITDSEGCTVTTNSVTMLDGPTQVLIDEQEVCEGANASLTPSLDPVVSGGSFQWFLDKALTKPIVSSPNPTPDGQIYQINPSTGVLTISGLTSSPSDYTFYATASGSTICPGFIGEGKIKVFGKPTATSSVVNEVCFGDGGQITINASGGSGSYTYSLNGGSFVSSNIFKVSTGIYIVEVRTPEGCNYLLNNITVTGPSDSLAIQDIEQNNPSCDLDNGDVRFKITGGYPEYAISYTKNGTASGTATAASDGLVTISGIGIGTYAFTVTDKEGCKISLPNSLIFTGVPTVITAADDVICIGETAELNPSVPSNINNPQFSWYLDPQGTNPMTSGTVSGITYTIAASGSMTISGLTPDSNGHTFYVSASGTGICGLVPKAVKVTVNDIPNLKVSNPSVVCDPNGTVDLTNYIEGFNPAVYDYNVVSPTGSIMRLEDIGAVQVSGDYRVSSSQKGKGCWNQPQRIRVIISDTLLDALFEYEVDLGGGIIVNNGDIQIEEVVQFDDLSQGKIILWEWNFGDGSTSSEQNPSHTFLEKGAFTIILRTVDEFGCEDFYEILVNVFDDYKVMVPNAFTPDGLKNTYFKPVYRGISSMEFYIFNTWGELIYESNSLENPGWDGTLNGIPTPNGNYVYKGRFVSRSGEVITKAGVFILIR